MRKLLFLCILLSGCGGENNTPQSPIVVEPEPLHNVWYTNYSFGAFTIINADGHEYLSAYKGGMVHMESCPCKKSESVNKPESNQ